MIAESTGDDPGQRDESGKSVRPADRSVSIANNRLDSRDLFSGTREIVILHGSDAYHLRLTAQNKLILTK